MTAETEAFALLREAFPDMTLIEVIQEQLMTDVITPGVDEWTGDGEAEGFTYPEYPANPHNHRFTISFDPTKPPFVVVRANTAAELKAAFDELVDSGAYAVMTAAQAALRNGGQAPASSPAASGAPQFQAMAQQQFNQQPAQQFPGVTGQAPAAWQNAGAPAPQQQQWGGQQAQQGGTRAVPKPRPNGWYQTDKNSGPGADAWKAMRENNQPMVKAKISWGGGSTFWVDPSIAQWVAQQGFALMAT